MNLNLVFRLLLYHIFVLSTCVSDIMVFFRRLIMVRVVFVPSFNSKDCFERGMILFNSRICICECPVEVNYPQKPLASTDDFFSFYVCIYKYVLAVSLCVCVHTWVYIHVHLCIYTPVHTYFRVVSFSFPFLSVLTRVRTHLTPQIDIFFNSLCVYMFEFVSAYKKCGQVCVCVCVRAKLGSV